MRIISERILREYWEAHADTRGPLEAWLEFVRRAKWEKPADAQKDYATMLSSLHEDWFST